MMLSGKGEMASTLPSALLFLADPWPSIRLSRLQGLDEVEELEMLLSHYAISWYACDAQVGSAFLSTTL